MNRETIMDCAKLIDDALRILNQDYLDKDTHEGKAEIYLSKAKQELFLGLSTRERIRIEEGK